jgi:hypothetical protein
VEEFRSSGRSQKCSETRLLAALRWIKWRPIAARSSLSAATFSMVTCSIRSWVGYYEGHELMYAVSVRAGILSEFRRVLPPHLEQLRILRCPFVNLPDRSEGRWGEGLTAAKIAACCWLHPFIVVRVEFLEWTLTIDCVIRALPESAAIRTQGRSCESRLPPYAVP